MPPQVTDTTGSSAGGRPLPRARHVCALALVLGCGGTIADRGSDAATDSQAPSDGAPNESGTTALDATIDVPEAAVDPDGGIVADGALATATAGEGQIACGATVCSAATQVCCLHADGEVSCTGLNACAGSPFVCSGPSSCPAPQACCAQFGQYFGDLVATQCGGCEINDESERYICTRGSQCGPDGPCRPVGGGGYGVCMGPFPDGGAAHD